MRLLILLLSLGIYCSCSSSIEIKLRTKMLNGTWIPLKQEIGGTALPAMAFEGQRLLLEDLNYTVTAESIDKGIVQYDGDKMDIYSKEGVNAGKHFTAIYKLDHDELTICYNLLGDSYPTVFDTKGKPLFFLSVFKKLKA